MTEFSKYIDGVKAKLGIKSDRVLAYQIGISTAYMSNLKAGAVPDDDVAIKIASLADDDPEKILLLAHKSKASEKSRPYWDSLLKKVVEMSLIIFLSLAFLPEILHISSPPRYIM